MQIFLLQKLVFLAVPKTGTTAIEQALGQIVSIDIRRPPGAKHIGAQRFDRRFRPFLKKTFGAEVETFAVMRDPLDRVASWWRYLQRDEIVGSPRSMRGVSFDTFLSAHAQEDPDKMGTIGGDQADILMGDADIPLVNHIFQYGREDLILDFLEDRFGRRFEFPRVNASPAMKAEAKTDSVAAFRKKREREMALWRAVSENGYLHTPAKG